MLRVFLQLLLFSSLFAQVESHAPGSWEQRLQRASQSPQAWRARVAEIRQRILLAAGLWPPFERPALAPVIFGRIERDDYSIEKVHFETWRGFHFSGNLYRPRGKKGPFPAVLSPHGHASPGRFFDGPNSEPGRAVTLSRMGFVVFSYDMVGYGDLTQVPHSFEDSAWGLSLLGLQLWNSQRAVDFLTSLPDVDPARIGVSGASGGGTQSFMLAAVDDRVAVVAPVCMVAAEFQGGCSCENAPLLRIGLNNAEIAAAVAPRPLLLVSATGDWTKDNLKVECPAIQGAYKSLGAEGRFRCVQFNAGHNYNKDSREAVYAWLARWLQNAPDSQRLPEPPFTEENRWDLEVYTPDHPRPAGSVDAAGLAAVLKETITQQLEALKPRDAASLGRFRELMAPALRHTFTAEWPGAGEIEAEAARPETGNDGLTAVILKQNSVSGVFGLLVPKMRLQSRWATLVVGPESEETRLLAHALLERGEPAFVLHPRPHEKEADAAGIEAQREKHGSTYYRSALAWSVQDALTALAYVAGRTDIDEVRLVGLGESGIAALLARALAPKEKLGLTIADVSGIDDGAETTWTTGERSHPLMLRIGGLRTAATLVAPGALVIHNTQNRFRTDAIRTAYRAAGRKRALRVSQARWSTDEILRALQAGQN
jgi:dienelactone hydrolase